MHSATNFGIINALRTGNIILDISLSIFIPIILSGLMSKTFTIHDKVQRIYQKYFEPNVFSRLIEHNTYLNGYGEYVADSEDKDNTAMMYTALCLYISKNFPSTYTRGELKFVNPENNNRYRDEEDDEQNINIDDKDDKDDCNDIHTIKILRKYQIVNFPSSGEWVILTPTLKYNRAVEVNIDHDDNNNVHKLRKAVKTTIELYSSASNGKDEIDSFINKAMKWYEKYIISQHKNYRYMYMMDVNKPSEDSTLTFKRYTLSNNKTFSTIFIPNKKYIMSLIDDFQSQSGKFSIQGFPKQLNFLLTGPPGTGKTSLIKAISEYTDRHVVDIPISKIDTNQKLYDIMFGKNFRLSKTATDVRNFKNTIYVIEDIDCVNEIVQKRKKESETIVNSVNINNNMIENCESNNESDTKRKASKNSTKATENPFNKNFFRHTMNTDPLTLSGILNVIDGVIDCPQRILIITTNHPEKLDPALIRPGRINMKIYLGYTKPTEAIDMINNYIDGMSDKHKEKIHELFSKPNHTITTAMIEKLCIEYNTIDEILEYLELKILKT